MPATGKRPRSDTSPGLASGSGSDGAGSSRGDDNASPGQVSHAALCVCALAVRQSVLANQLCCSLACLEADGGFAPVRAAQAAEFVITKEMEEENAKCVLSRFAFFDHSAVSLT